MKFSDYQAENRNQYADLANTVAAILRVAIEQSTELRLQQINARAKTAHSLRKKLENRRLLDSEQIADEIKDLAGCRVIFYTDSDVTRFSNSGIIHANFEVVEVKLHYPQPDAENTSELFISNNYTVMLKPERTGLPEYARFKDMKCEIQIQTILNHAWSEMAHDTIYKKPTLDGFGVQALEGIERRMQRVMRGHLIPAGHDFQKIASDFERLLDGKELFDSKPLDAIVEAIDNNERYDALERFVEHVMPNFDDIGSEYPDIVKKLVQSIDQARQMETKSVETSFGTYPGKTPDDILQKTAEIIEQHRYVDVKLTFATLLKLYTGARSSEERKIIEQLAEKLASHELAVWKAYGPAIQAVLLDEIEQLPSDSFSSALPLLASVLGEVLKSEVGGTTRGDFNSIVIHRGAVLASDKLGDIRNRAIKTLVEMLSASTNETDQRVIFNALKNAGDLPRGATTSEELALLAVNDVSTITQSLIELAPSWSLEMRQFLEGTALHWHYWYRDVPEFFGDNEAIISAYAKAVALLIRLRDLLNEDREFVVYNMLVGYDSVFPSAWDGDPYDYKARDQWRKDNMPRLIEEVTEGNAAEWFQRLTRCAATESNDLATFPTLAEFLVQLSENKPDIVLAQLESLDEKLSPFLSGMMRGLIAAGKLPDIRQVVLGWIENGEYLSDISYFFRSNADLEQDILERICQKAIELKDGDVVLGTLLAAVRYYVKKPGSVIKQIFFPALDYLSEHNDWRWAQEIWFSWRESSITDALTPNETKRVLDAMVPVPRLDHNATEILASFSAKSPVMVLSFLGDRIDYRLQAQNEAHYEPLPHHIHGLKENIEKVPDKLVVAAQSWSEKDRDWFHHLGTDFIISVFPDFPEPFQHELSMLVDTQNAQHLRFVTSILNGYNGENVILPMCKKIIETFGQTGETWRLVSNTIQATGVVSGEYGLVEEYKKRKAAISAWLKDGDPQVAEFAEHFVQMIDQYIAAEQQRAEQSVEFRRRDWSDDDDSPDGPEN